MINPQILKPKVMRELSSGFRENNPQGVQVQGFMDTESYKKFLAAIAKAEFKKAEVRDMHSFFEDKPPVLKLFSSNEFLSFAAQITGKKIAKAECSLRIFMAGCYTLMHDEAQKGVEFYFDITSQWETRWGGATFFVTEGGQKLMIPPAPNTLVIAESGRSYVKYVNRLAGQEGRLVVYGVLK